MAAAHCISGQVQVFDSHSIEFIRRAVSSLAVTSAAFDFCRLTVGVLPVMATSWAGSRPGAPRHDQKSSTRINGATRHRCPTPIQSLARVSRPAEFCILP
jgi:hypothetical protein